MTGKERLDWLCRLRSFLTQCGMPKEWRANFNQALSETIKALEQEPYMDWYDVPSDEMTLEQARQAVKDLRKKLAEYLEQDQKTEWIPVSERLPKKYTYTLWCASSGYVRSDYFNGEYWEDAKKLCYDVIAWMPLPEPYKSEVDQ